MALADDVRAGRPVLHLYELTANDITELAKMVADTLAGFQSSYRDTYAINLIAVPGVAARMAAELQVIERDFTVATRAAVKTIREAADKRRAARKKLAETLAAEYRDTATRP